MSAFCWSLPFMAGRPNIVPPDHHFWPSDQICWPLAISWGRRISLVAGVLPSSPLSCLYDWTCWEFGECHHFQCPPMMIFAASRPFAYRVVVNFLIELYFIFLKSLCCLSSCTRTWLAYRVSLFCLLSCKSVHYLIITMRVLDFQTKFNFVPIAMRYHAMRCIESTNVTPFWTK